MRGRRLEWTAAGVALAAVTGFLWLAWALAQGKLTKFDETFRASLHSFANPILTLFMQLVTLTGSQPVVLGITAVAAVVLFRAGRRGSGTLLLIAVGGAELLENVLKVQFHRQRPEPFLGAILPGSYSFPSGHALISLTLYGVLCWVVSARVSLLKRRLIRVATSALILAIGVSRVYLGVHHPTDVIGGYLIAIAWIFALRAVRVRISTINT